MYDFRALFKRPIKNEGEAYFLGTDNAGRKKTQIIAIVNQKGGCGKTTTCINLAASLAKKGFRTLIIDLDPQSHATLGLGIESYNLNASIYDVLIKGVDLDQVILPTYSSNLDIAPATTLLTGAQLEVADLLGREGMLRTAVYKMLNMRRGKEYDYILLDCSPSLNLITINGLAAAQSVLIPVQAHYFSLEGMKELFSTVKLVKERINPELSVLGIVVTLFMPQIKMCRTVLDQLRDYFEGKVFDTVINMHMTLVESTAMGKAIVDFAPNSKPAKEFDKLTSEIANLLDQARLNGHHHNSEEPVSTAI